MLVGTGKTHQTGAACPAALDRARGGILDPRQAPGQGNPTPAVGRPCPIEVRSLPPGRPLLVSPADLL